VNLWYAEKWRSILIKAVAFDYGGVISLGQDEKAMKDMADLAGIDTALMRRIYWDNRPIYDQGLVTGAEYFKNILADVGVFADPELIEKLIVRDLLSWSTINPETEKLMKDLKAAGFKTAILSNMVQEFVDRVKETLPVLSIPDISIYSCNVDAIKPEEKIYRILLSELDCAAEELVFFDDTAVNVEAASKLGIQAFYWKDPGAARRELEILGIGRF
jgi:putative hydrolase of the HAD superfamily